MEEEAQGADKLPQEEEVNKEEADEPENQPN